MHLRFPAIAIALIAGPACAAVPGDNVRCIYDQLSAEDREIATMMTMDLLDRGADDEYGLRAAEEVETLVRDPYIFCSDKYPWGYIQTQNAQSYVINRLLSNAAIELLLIFGEDPVVIDGYFAQNRVALLKQAKLNEKTLGQLNTYLESKGWNMAKEGTANVAPAYFKSLWLLEKLSRAFDRSELFDPSDT